MPITLFTGLPGAGKSLKMADELLQILRRNVRWYAKSGVRRLVYSNLRINPRLEQEYNGFIQYWSDPFELIKIRDADVFWDEIATHLDSTQWKETPIEMKRWLQQHRKFGIEIYGTTQDFAMIDVSFRRMTNQLYILRKLIGSRDKSNTKPDVKYIWGVIIVRQMNPQDYKETEKENKAYGFDLFLITKKRISVFDTTQEILMGKYPPLKHIDRTCMDENCTFHRVLHI